MSKKLFAGADKNIFERARALRRQPTEAEEVLWMYLRQKPLGFKFRRQHPFGIYVLDFYCHPLKLAIEVDGSIHDVTAVQQNDSEGTAILNQLGIQVIRFSNQQIMSELAAVIQTIETKLPDLKHVPSK